MILDSLKHAQAYSCLHPGLGACFEFLQNRPLEDLDEGKHTIDGRRLFAVVQKGTGKGMGNARLETHDKYIDVQLSAAGQDLIGWETRGSCQADDSPDPPSGDVRFYTNKPATWLAVGPGRFALLFPDDAHAPWGCAEWVHKVVIKIALDW